MTLDITQFYQTFFDEADELLAQMEQLLLNLDVGSPDPEDLAAIFRAAHSIKGGAATFGFSALTETTHILESLLDRARNHELTLTKEMVDAFLETKDVLSDQLVDYRASAEPDAAAAATICAKLERLKAESGAGAPAADDVAPAVAAVAAAPAPAPAAGSNGAPDHVVEQAVAAAHPAADVGADGPHLKITLVGVDPKDQALLTEELGNLGRIVGREEAGADLTLWLESDVSSDDITAVCCFVIDDSQIRIARGTAPAAPAAPAAAPAAESLAAPAAAPEPAARVEVFAQAPGAAPAAAAPQAQPGAAVQPAPQPAPQPHAEPAAPAAAHHDDKRPRPAGAAAGAEGSSIRVGVEKVDQLINLVGELVITQAMLAETASAFDPALHDRLFNGMAQLERNARDLQEAVMSIRMMPMDYVFSRFPRLVRDLAGKLGKQVELVTFGQATELDKSLIERIIDPLTHLVRNSLDHGIETVDKRVAAGKDAVGQLVLSAAHHGGNIVIEVSDDGGGLNRERILAKAAKQGMQVSDNISDDEVWQLIFAPGFSTAETVTDVSGRGVGMDVVKRNIQSMGGHVEISSQAGRGTTTRIVLPLTLAILDGMSVKVGSEIFILPLNFVMESLQPSNDDIYTVGNGERVVRVRGEYLPLVALHEVFSVEDARTDPTQGIVTIMETEGRRFAMLIDELVGQQQVVVKNLETNYRKVHGISAATILGDGSVALIVDVAALNRETRAMHGARVGAELAIF
ncbi:signal transducing histidine kinase, homodimeric domain protein [Burkholderia ambifaria AMMD]|uniref:Chemotaxis protein CheA n=2 Tax=Burkholderia ambifaria TaxID=152480 RepID=Q0BJE3_BURCM|nr:chemotaxis protein CheA [Burkholderia ambifaria]ABI85730.1 CheA signal transduction histidine kinase [Burkholderia ambifaria AMMD]AJY22736.1 signal transducing histidine kinase, homodimeric domain protein [Burkholderia ambifaria AMMD]PEH66932.1 chemotaxis protein CheA [Burkholderia ambifaria]QQC03908.1 chemotaxis protein CheA [Burkholderia ambifaria]UZU05323.1 chemotaxis protein CheA [Burkholderia ambifaria]